MDVERAIRIIAQDVISVAVKQFVEEGWESYPDIGEQDWNSVVGEALILSEAPDFSPFDEALDLLSLRAEKFDEDATLAIGDE